VTLSVGYHPGDLEAALVEPRTYVTRRQRTRIGVTALMSSMICLLYLIPAPLYIPQLAAVGRPALVLALLLFCWWVLSRLHPGLVMTGPQPMRWVVLIYVVSTLLSYAAGLIRGLTVLEANGQNLALIGTAEFLGVILMFADGLQNWGRLYGVLRVLVWCSGFMALVGLLQFALKKDVTRYLVLPGLKVRDQLAGFGARGFGFERVASTTAHYIEFSACMAVLFPYAVHLALFSPTRRRRFWFGVVAALDLFAIPATLSRTGLVALAVGILVIFPVWRWRTRFNAVILAMGAVAALAVAKPGLIGTLGSLFSGASGDPSIQHRTNDYPIVFYYFNQRPWLGRGPGTFIPAVYGGRVLDNQWLGQLLGTGLLGVAALAALHVAGIVLAAVAWRRSSRLEDRHLCACLVSTMLIGLVVAGTFDSMGFTTYSTTLALLMGMCGAVWRFTHPARQVRTASVRRV
jgi:O-antigen ligase